MSETLYKPSDDGDALTVRLATEDEIKSAYGRIIRAKRKTPGGGRKPKLTDAQVEEVRQRAAAGENRDALADQFGVSRTTIYRAIRGAS